MDNDSTDSLQYLPMERWVELEKAFLADWPRGIPAYNGLVTQRNLKEQGLDYGFKVYCPYGDVNNGMVAFNKKANFNEVIIQCPKDDTSKLEEAIISTKLVDWTSTIIVPYLPEHMKACVARVAKKIGVECDTSYVLTHHIVYFSRESRPFEDVGLPDDVKFQLLSEELIDKIDSYWVNRYDSSKWFFQLLIRNKTGYGLFKNNELITWVFVNEIGSLAHLFTLENHRQKGYAKMLMKLLCNLRIKEKKDVFACCLHTNSNALKMYKDLGFEKLHAVEWYTLKPKQGLETETK